MGSAGRPSWAVCGPSQPDDGRKRAERCRCKAAGQGGLGGSPDDGRARSRAMSGITTCRREPSGNIASTNVAPFQPVRTPIATAARRQHQHDRHDRRRSSPHPPTDHDRQAPTSPQRPRQRRAAGPQSCAGRRLHPRLHRPRGDDLPRAAAAGRRCLPRPHDRPNRPSLASRGRRAGPRRLRPLVRPRRHPEAHGADARGRHQHDRHLPLRPLRPQPPASAYAPRRGRGPRWTGRQRHRADRRHHRHRQYMRSQSLSLAQLQSQQIGEG